MTKTTKSAKRLNSIVSMLLLAHILSAAVFLDFLLLKSVSFHSKNAWY